VTTWRPGFSKEYHPGLVQVRRHFVVAAVTAWVSQLESQCALSSECFQVALSSKRKKILFAGMAFAHVVFFKHSEDKSWRPSLSQFKFKLPVPTVTGTAAVTAGLPVFSDSDSRGSRDCARAYRAECTKVERSGSSRASGRAAADRTIWNLALYDIIYDIRSLWYYLWYHRFLKDYDIIVIWYHMTMISWFWNYDISNFWYHRSMIS
jgi:hypothetical protein